MSDDDLDLREDEFLMSTRQRRANAGNKMRKLLEQELEDIQSRTEQLEEDEVDLLFREDDDDEEFEAEASSDTEVAKRSHNVDSEANGEADEMFSESEEESGDQNEDNEEGEKDLQRQEQLQRKKRNKRKTPAVIKRKRINPEDNVAKKEQEARKRAHYEQIKAENLLISNRRTSQRSSVVANKMKVYEKLSQAEKKRKLIQDRIRKHKEAQREEILTQEDRIQIALETEKFNILSLDKYKEQEVSKKQSRIALQQRQKLKFTPGETVIRQLSCSWTITPLMELEDAEYWAEQIKRREKKKKKYTRRPYKKHNQDVKNDNKEVKVKEELAEKIQTVAESTEESSSNVEINGVQKSVLGTDSDKKVETPPPENIEMQKANDEEITVDNRQSESNVAPIEFDSEPPKDKDNLTKPQISGEELPVKAKQTTSSHKELEFPDKYIQDDFTLSHPSKKRTSTPQPSNKEKEANTVSPSTPKQVTFADQPQVTLIDFGNRPSDDPPTTAATHETDQQGTPDLIEDLGSEEEQIYQGPEQLVGKNFVTLYSFPTETYRNDIHEELFGVNWENGLSHRSSDVETICKLTMPEVKSDHTETTSLTPNLSFLNNFPAFGEYDKKVIHDNDATVNKEFEIDIKTLPPTGVFLPSGSRKKCLISSKECQYFDPKNGVPYSDVETYKTIQELQNPIGTGSEEEPQPHFQWFGFGNGGIYLDISQTPAKGVPDDF